MTHAKSLLSALTLATLAQAYGCDQAKAPHASHVAAIYAQDGHRLPDYMASSDQVNWKTLTASDPHYLDWNGVGSISPGCTATLLKKAQADGPAYLITAGHCYIHSYDDPSTLLVDTPTSQNAQLGRYVRRSGAPSAARVHIDKIAYATMNGTDVSILQASSSYRELIEAGVHPLELSATPPVVGEALVMPHEPLEGVDSPGMRLSYCTVGSLADIREEPFHSEGVFRNHCSAVGGTSGAPVLSVASGKIIGLLTTGTRDNTVGQPDCVDSRPCEVQGNAAATTFPDENYAQHVYQFASCFDGGGNFDLSLASCAVTKP